MINLHNIEQASLQEIFNQVATHMLTQKEQSIGKDPDGNGGRTVCLYRSGNLKCAAGCLIADDEYKPLFENKSFTGLWKVFKESHFSNDLEPQHKDMVNLVTALQEVHDSGGPNPETNWFRKLSVVAQQYNLEMVAQP